MKKIRVLVCLAVLTALVAMPCAVQAGTPVNIALSRFSLNSGDQEPTQEQEQTPSGATAPASVAPSAVDPVAPLYPFVADQYALSGDLNLLDGYDLPYVIGVDVANQVITVVERGADGRYGAPVKIFLCSTGARGTPTPLGHYYLPDEVLNEWVYFPTSKVYVRYPVRIQGNYFFHSLVYAKRSLSTRTTASLRALGTPASGGCIRMLDEDIFWMHQTMDRGSLVIIYEGNPDPDLNAALRPQAQRDLK